MNQNAYQMFSTLLFAKADGRGIPLSGTFELTARCNLNCKMCYIHRQANDRSAMSKERTAGEWLELARQCREAGTLLLLFTGGEPFLRPDFKEIYSGCKRMGMLVSINTNATLIDREMVAFLAADPPARMNITLYGASRATYAALCGDGGAYDRAVEAILALKEAGILVKLNFSATPYNTHDAEKVYAFARDNGLPLQAATYMFPPVRACEQGCFTADRLTPAQAAQAQLTYDKFRFTPQELKERWEKQLNGISVPDPDSECQELPTQRIRCRAGSSTFWVTYDWQLRPCGMMTVPTTGLEQGFSTAWETIHAARETIMTPGKCAACPARAACDQCAALCYGETGDFAGVPTYLCEKARAYLDLAREAMEN